MAEGRMLNRSVATDDRLNAMSRDAMLLYLMAVPHLDRDGLTDGRPRVLWATVAPLQDEWFQRVDALIDEWVASELVVRYHGEDRPILFFTGFAKNQSRMLYQRERASKFPCPPGFVRTPSGLRPAGDPAHTDDDPARAEFILIAGEGRAPDADSEQSARDEVVRESRTAHAEDQDQAEHQDQTEHQAKEEKEDQHQAQAEAGRCGNGDLSPTFPHVPNADTLVTGSAGELVAYFTLEELRTAAYRLGKLLNLHMEWMGYEGFVGRREAGSLAVLLEWIEFYRAMPPTALRKIENLPGLIRSHLNKGDRAPLTSAQRRELAAAVINTLTVVEEGTK
jgi:hypothetical protein